MRDSCAAHGRADVCGRASGWCWPSYWRDRAELAFQTHGRNIADWPKACAVFTMASWPLPNGRGTMHEASRGCSKRGARWAT